MDVTKLKYFGIGNCEFVVNLFKFNQYFLPSCVKYCSILHIDLGYGTRCWTTMYSLFKRAAYRDFACIYINEHIPYHN